EAGHEFKRIISIGGGAKSADWLQMQADVFQAPVTSLQYEEGPGFGAAMIAAYGLGWFDNLAACAQAFIQFDQTYEPNKANASHYEKQFEIYQRVYAQTAVLTKDLLELNS